MKMNRSILKLAIVLIVLATGENTLAQITTTTEADSTVIQVMSVDSIFNDPNCGG